MMKRILCMAVAVLSFIGFQANAQQLTPLPLNPQVRSGVLPNGLSYYVLHNEEPKNRANFYIAQKVGSSLETPDQLGLAHFLEHMAFNGTKHFPGKSMLNYLQHKGIRFGQDINAYTSFDETVYNINNVPTNDVALMDSVLLVLSDWSDSILLEGEEIEAERGVIQEEWRQRNNAQTRMFTYLLPILYKEYQYQQMPIGKMDVVMNFSHDALRNYYHKWYRPDQQGIVVVGDFDVAEMEKKVVDLFSKITMPENAAERIYPKVSDNVEPIYAYYSDPELQSTRITISFKYDKLPIEARNTVEAYVFDILERRMIQQLINLRLNEFSKSTECDYAGSSCYFSDYYVSKTKGAFNIVIVAKNDIINAIKDAMGIIARACKAGFTESEVERVRQEMLATYERLYNERNKMNNDDMAQELINFFVNNDPAPGIETEFEIAKAVLPRISVAELNQIAALTLTSENQVITVSESKESADMKDSVLNEISSAINAEYEAYMDEVITEPIIKKLPKPGKIKLENKNEEIGTTEYILSNGARVVIKPTDYASDQIILTAFKKGGKDTYLKDQADNLNLLDMTFDLTKWGPFNMTNLMKYLAGKKVGLGYSMGAYTTQLKGSSTIKDLPTLMELIYTVFTALGPDQEIYKAQMSNIEPTLANFEKDPNKVFSKTIMAARYDNNPMMMPMSLSTIKNADYNRQLDILKKSMSNAADYVFIFTGNISEEEFETLMNQYLGTLPSKKKAVVAPVVTPIQISEGEITRNFDIEAQTPSVQVFRNYSGKNITLNYRNDVMMNFIGELLQIIYTETLREEMGGTYGAGTTGFLNQSTGEWNIIFQFQTNEEMSKAMIERAALELHNLLVKGAKPEHFNKVKEAALKQLEIMVNQNEYWNEGLVSYYRGYNTLTNAYKTVESISIEELNKFMKQLDGTPNVIEVVMNQKVK